jgi:hypothetical protein
VYVPVKIREVKNGVVADVGVGIVVQLQRLDFA